MLPRCVPFYYAGQISLCHPAACPVSTCRSVARQRVAYLDDASSRPGLVAAAYAPITVPKKKV